MKFDELNEKQQAAVKATEGKVRIIAYLVDEMGIDPACLLAKGTSTRPYGTMPSHIAGHLTGNAN